MIEQLARDAGIFAGYDVTPGKDVGARAVISPRLPMGVADDIEPGRKGWCFHSFSMDRPYGSGKQMMMGKSGNNGIRAQQGACRMEPPAGPVADPVAAGGAAGRLLGHSPGTPGTSPPPRETAPQENVLPSDAGRHRVALLVPLTGPNAAVGQAIANATTMALLDTNAHRCASPPMTPAPARRRRPARPCSTATA
jgi:hypothetical protein